MSAVVSIDQMILERAHLTGPTGAKEEGFIAPNVAITPALGPDYWAYRVMLTETQAVLGFWKFGMIGIGFAAEEDWNSNLPHGVDTERLFAHIEHNRGDDAITDEHIIAAIALIQEAVVEDDLCTCRTCATKERP